MSECKHCDLPIYRMKQPVDQHRWAHTRNGWIVCEENPTTTATPKEKP
ncbi:hypothetical protein DEU38_103166 [Rhodococcus sp. AG1013]|nr:hypothetical protein [Rhodococcus sp. AG1013]RDI32433.1 hypothetical protein DEU38_103166 [Rhodococcus sp. AG1013]